MNFFIVRLKKNKGFFVDMWDISGYCSGYSSPLSFIFI
jgi:hypothetical protein